MIEPVLKDEAFLADVLSTPGVNKDTFRLRWLGQSGYLLQWRRLHALLDPYLSDSLTKKYSGTEKPHVRMTARVVAPECLTFIDVATATHGHTDHLDPETLRPLARASPGVALVCPAAIRDLALDRANILPIGLVDGSHAHVRDFHITAVPAAHDKLEVDEQGRHKFLGFVIRFGRWTVYHSGDTVVYDGMVERLRPFGVDVAILPINGKVGNMGGRDAARLAKDIGAKLVVPCHYEMFEFNTADPRDEFIPECEQLRQPYKVLRAGERLTLQA